MIPPGGSLSGYTLASAGIPGIKKYFIEGYTENDTPHFEGGSAEEENAVDNLSDFFNNSTSGMTLGPDVISSSMPVDALIDRLTALKHESATNGWLGDAKFVLKLDRRLGEAKAALAAGKPALARVRLTQFVHDLTVVHEEHGDAGRSRERGKERDERRREKFVNDDAYQLLKINADYIVAKLPEKAKGRDEEEECRRAEAETDGGGAKAGNGGRGSPGHDR
jgi:hypothetical protein